MFSCRGLDGAACNSHLLAPKDEGHHLDHYDSPAPAGHSSRFNTSRMAAASKSGFPGAELLSCRAERSTRSANLPKCKLPNPHPMVQASTRLPARSWCWRCWSVRPQRAASNLQGRHVPLAAAVACAGPGPRPSHNIRTNQSFKLRHAMPAAVPPQDCNQTACQTSSTGSMLQCGSLA